MVKVPATNLVANPATTNALRDIRPPVEIPNGWAWAIWAVAVLALLGLAFLVYYWWRHSARAVPVVPPVPPHIRARQRLREALLHLNDPRQFCILVSDIVRAYLEERFNFHAPERTTEEFLHELQATQLLTPAQKGSLGDFLQRCDLVKFARYEPTERELQDLHNAAHRLVDETAETAPEPSATAASPEAFESAPPPPKVPPPLPGPGTSASSEGTP